MEKIVQAVVEMGGGGEFFQQMATVSYVCFHNTIPKEF